MNFTEIPPDDLLSIIEFDFEQFISVALRLLKLDSNLARMHAKLSPRMKEELFWQLYHFRIIFLRVKIGFEANDHDHVLHRYLGRENEIIFKNVFPKSISRNSMNNTSQKENNNGNKKNNGNDNDDEDIDEIITQRRIADAELKAEVEAELSNDIDLDALENELNNIDDNFDDDFEDLGIDDDDGLDSIGDGLGDIDVDDDLEKEIARELNNNTDND